MGSIEIIRFPNGGPSESRKIEIYVPPTEAPPNWPPPEIENDPEPEPNRPPARNLD
jgi:hypothetical protein